MVIGAVMMETDFLGNSYMSRGYCVPMPQKGEMYTQVTNKIL